jgi:hypothetical protein
MTSIKFVVVITLMMLGDHVFARFHESDELEIDPDQNFNTETWNDKNSYMWPLSLQNMWNDTWAGYRGSAGSLSMTRFNYDEDIKLQTNPLSPWSIRFLQERREDYVEQQSQRALILGRKLFSNVRLLLMSDGSTWKEYGDIGAGLRLFESATTYFDLHYWSVDHYYNSKKSDEHSEHLKNPHTWAADLKWSLGDWKILSHFEWDAPFTWQRKTYDYDYKRTRSDTKLSHGEYYLKFDRDIKSESKTSRVNQATQKSLARHSYLAEIGNERTFNDGTTLILAFQWIERHTDFGKRGDETELAAWNENNGPPWSDRREWGLLSLREVHWLDDLDFSYGLFLNRVLIDEVETWNAFEAKAQTGLIIHATEKGRFTVNATWDLDQIQRDFPYKEKSFRPWGGGALQGLIAF